MRTVSPLFLRELLTVSGPPDTPPEDAAALVSEAVEAVAASAVSSAPKSFCSVAQVASVVGAVSAGAVVVVSPSVEVAGAVAAGAAAGAAVVGVVVVLPPLGEEETAAATEKFPFSVALRLFKVSLAIMVKL